MRLPGTTLRAILWACAGLALAFRLALPYWIEGRVAQGMGEAGHLRGVGLSLWRLAFQYQGLEFRSHDPGVTAPTFSCPEVDIALEWRALFRGRLGARVTLKNPLLNLFTPYASEKPAEKDAPYWAESVRGLVPFTIDKIEVVDGLLHYRDPGENPQIDLHLEGIGIQFENFSGRNSSAEKFPGSAQAGATAMQEGSVALKGRFNPLAASPDFEYKVRLLGLKLRGLNPLLLRFAGVDLQGGSLDLDYSASAGGGKYRGRVETTIKGLQVMKPHESFRPARLAKKTFLGFMSWYHKDSRDELRATKEFHGRFEDPQIMPLKAALDLFAVAFIEALS